MSSPPLLKLRFGRRRRSLIERELEHKKKWIDSDESSLFILSSFLLWSYPDVKQAKKNWNAVAIHESLST